MVTKIVKQIQNELITALSGEVGAVYNVVPETILELKSVYVIRRTKTRIFNEIGQRLGSNQRYAVDVLIAVSDGDPDTGLDTVDKLERLVTAHFLGDSSSLKNLEQSENGVLERVLQYDILSVDYPENEVPFDTQTYLAILHLEVLTQLQPS